MEKEEILEVLWQKAEALDAEISSLSEETNELFRRCELVRQGKIPCAHLEDFESPYWETMREIETVRSELNKFLDVIQVVETTGQVSAASQFLASGSEDEIRRISKRRRAIEAQKHKMPSSPTDDPLFMPGFYDSTLKAVAPERPTNGRLVHTGRHATHVTGGFRADEAAGAFFEATADTHGGKVRGGSKAPKGYYVTASGKKVRKR